MSATPDPQPNTAAGPARRRWAFSAGWIPPASTGREPEGTSREVLCLLNVADLDACVEATVHHPDREPVGPYRIAVSAGRVKHVRMNDLIDPEAVPLGRAYGLMLVSDVPVVVQLAHVDTGDGQRTTALLNGVPGD